MNTNSIDLELSSSQYLSITDGNQTGLDLNSDFTIECWIKLEQLPSTVGNLMVIVGKDDRYTESYRAYMLYLTVDDKLAIYYNDEVIFKRGELKNDDSQLEKNVD